MGTWRSVLAAYVMLAGSVLAGCGGNKLAAPLTQGDGVSGSSGCSAGAWLCEGFDQSLSTRWETFPQGAGATVGTADGAWAIEPDASGNVLHYRAGKSKGVAAVIKEEVFAPVKARHSADYYVEARIRPITETISGNRFICLLGRYQDVNNWYGGCLNVQNGSNSKVEFHKAVQGKWFRTRQFDPRTILNDRWYKLRMEMQGETLSFYIDDDLVGRVQDASIKAPGKIGVWLDNRSFLMDDVVVGDARVKPVLLSVSPAGVWNAEQGGPDREVTVSASKSDGSEDAFSVVSSDPTVVSVEKAGNKTRLRALKPGDVTLSYTSASNPAKVKTIAASIEPAFVQVDSQYGELNARTIPVSGMRNAYPDETVRLRFDAPVSLTGKGSVRIFRADDDALVDVVKPIGESEAIGPSADHYYRGVALPLMKLAGDTLVVHPHAGKLQYGVRYYLTVAPGTVREARLNGLPFNGLGKKAGWFFTTRAAPKPGLMRLNVAQSGDQADFRSVQGALNYAMQSVGKDTPVSIDVRNGVYDELLYLRGKNNVTIRGESRDQTILQFESYESLNGGSGAGLAKPNASTGGGRAVLLVEDSDLLTLDQLTLQNPHVKVAGINNQAEVIFFNGSTHRLIARNANFISRQDTLQLNAYSWFYNTLIAGDVDFIWGSAKAALFENSEIRTVVDSSDPSKGGYLVQARVLNPADKGYVFLNSRITREAGVPDGSADLARSAGVPTFYDNVVYINCQMDRHIEEAGWWANPIPNPAEPKGSEGWREFGTKRADGASVASASRVSGARFMSAEEAAFYQNRGQVFSAINWAPQP